MMYDIGIEKQDVMRNPDASLKSLTSPLLKMVGVGVVGFVLIALWGGVIYGVARVVVGSAEWLRFTQIGGTILGAISVVLLYLKQTDKTLDFIDFHLLDKEEWFVVGTSTLGVILLSWLLGWLLESVGVEIGSHSIISEISQIGSPELLLVFVPISFFIISPGEELIYRNVIQKHLYDYLTPVWSVIAATGVFTVVHAPSYVVGVVVRGQAISSVAASLGVVAAISIILGMAYAKTENLVVPILIHGLYNSISFVQSYFAAV